MNQVVVKTVDGWKVSSILPIPAPQIGDIATEIHGLGHVRYWPLADIAHVAIDLAFGGKADIGECNAHVCF